MTASVEQLCQTIAEHRLLPSAELSRLRARWFRPGRADVNDVNKFGQWLSVNGFLTAFTFRMLRDGKTDLLRLNQYQLIDHLASGPFAGAYLALDPLQRHVVVEVLSAQKAADPVAVRAFQEAAQQAMTVQHPNVSATLDFGEARGRHYLVREYDEGETLADILARRGRLQPVVAARIFALALVGLQALHDKRVPAGPLNAESLLLSAPGKAAGGKARTIKILHSGVPRSQLDPSALDAAVSTAPAPSSAAPAAPSSPHDDLFRLGITLCHSLTGQSPLALELAIGSQRAVSVRQLAPEVPELLAQLVESMIDPSPAQRPAGAAQAAKSLRVFLASEEEAAQARPEENIVPHHAPAASAPAAEHSQPEEPEAPAEEGEWSGQTKALWKELRPGQRDWVFFSVGAAAVVVLVLFVTLLTGIRFVNVVCLLAGGALSFFVERLLRLREQSPQGE